MALRRARRRTFRGVMLAALAAPLAMTARGAVTWEQLAAQPAPPDGLRIAYAGESPLQFGVLRVPPGAGPHPVAVVIHGGCWEAEYDLRHVELASAALAEAGIATWTLEYRRLGDDGGGWPGTLLDVARGVDYLRVLAAERPLDLARVVLVGHSAGGHLALWAAGRARLPEGSELRVGEPLPIRGVVALAAISDLRRYALGDDSCNRSAKKLVGGERRYDGRYAQANPFELAPLGVAVRLVHGTDDLIVPLSQSRRFATREREGNRDVDLAILPGVGHFDLVAPFAPAWREVQRRILELAWR
ncbi:MAG TPA: alpha/beta hydrolase [Gammaproteobacteria bacterium]